VAEILKGVIVEKDFMDLRSYKLLKSPMRKAL